MLLVLELIVFNGTLFIGLIFSLVGLDFYLIYLRIFCKKSSQFYNLEYGILLFSLSFSYKRILQNAD